MNEKINNFLSSEEDLIDLLEDDDDDDEVDNTFIKIVSRNHPMFRNRSITFTHLEGDKIITERLPAVPDDVIVCDGCNSLIKDDLVGLLMLEVGRCWGTQCKDCIKKYYSDLPIVYEHVL